MDFLTLVNTLKIETGASGTDLVTVANQTGESRRLVNWINAAWMDIQGQNTDWQWMRQTVTFVTVTGQPTYSIAQIGLTDFGNWKRDTFRNYANPAVTISIGAPGVVTLAAHNLVAGQTVTFYTDDALPTGLTAGTAYYVVAPTSNSFSVATVAGGAAIATSGTQSGTHTITSNNTTTFAGLKSEIFMDYIDYESWRDGYQFGALRQTQTRPMSMTITPDKSIGVGPNPISGYTMLGDYYSVPTGMVNNTDVPAMPVQYHMVIVYRALIMYGYYESAPEAVQRGQIEFDKLMRRLLATRLSETRCGGALA